MAVTLRHGVNRLSLEGIAGRTVADVRGQAEELLNIPEGASAQIGGARVGDERILVEGETLEFVKTAGEKG